MQSSSLGCHNRSVYISFDTWMDANECMRSISSMSERFGSDELGLPTCNSYSLHISALSVPLYSSMRIQACKCKSSWMNLLAMIPTFSRTHTVQHVARLLLQSLGLQNFWKWDQMPFIINFYRAPAFDHSQWIVLCAKADTVARSDIIWIPIVDVTQDMDLHIAFFAFGVFVVPVFDDVMIRS